MYQIPTLTPLTTRHGLMTQAGRTLSQPEPASVVMTEGETGTAWQRWHKDGKWHRLGGGRPLTWTELLGKPGLVLVYQAPARVTAVVGPEVGA